MTKQLIVNADDYGRTRGVSSGIRSAHINGIITSTTSMMNMPGIDKCLEEALKECPQLGLGVHLVLTSGKPLLPANQIPSLTGGKDHFPSPPEFIRLVPEIDPNQVCSEWNAQIEKFIRLTGKKPDHLDSHHHTSYFSEPLFEIMLELARNQECGIRPPLTEGVGDLTLDLPAEIGDQSKDFISPLLKRYNPRRPHHFFPNFYNQNATSKYLLNLLANLPAGTSEIMCHPGLSDPELMEGSSYNIQREFELVSLIDSDLKTCIRDHSIQLITYAQLSFDKSNE